MSAIARQHPAVAAAFWMTGALASFSAMAISGRVLSADMGTFQLLFCRSVVGLVVVLLLLRRAGWTGLSLVNLPLQGLRNVVHFGGQFGWFFGLAYIPLAEVFALEFTTPIWTALIATVFMGERMTRGRLAAIVLGFAGMLVILRPGLAVVNVASLAVLAGAFCYGASHAMTKRLLARGETPLAVLFWMTCLQLPMGLVPALPDWQPLTWSMAPWLLLVGTTALGAHYCIARALKLADATVVVPMDFLRLPLIALVGWVVWDEPLEWLVLAGALLMLAGNLASIRAERRARPERGAT